MSTPQDETVTPKDATAVTAAATDTDTPMEVDVAVATAAAVAVPTLEDTATAAASAAAVANATVNNPVGAVATEALAAAAVVAVTASANANANVNVNGNGNGGANVEDGVEAVATDTTNASPEEATGVGGIVAAESSTSVSVGRLSILSEVDGQGKRRFFPRVKHLIGNKEWEDFLTQVLQCIEEAGAPETAAASHKANNSWYKAFDLIYGGVAREYSIPTGKNRYHKFKDKILEVWVALESQAPGENHCRDLAMEQYERYKRACSDANKTATGSHHGGAGSLATGMNKASKTGAGQTASSSASYKLAGGKRSYSTAMGGGAAASSGGAGLWKNLNETEVLASLPAELSALVHLKQLSKEMAAGMANRVARKGIDEHSKKLDGAYLEALTRYLAEDDAAGEAKAAEESSAAADVEMADGSDEVANDSEAASDAKTGEAVALAAAANVNAASTAYDRCLAVALLYRYASTLHEQRVLAEAYARYTARCVTFVVERPATPPNANSTIDAIKTEDVAAPSAVATAAVAVAAAPDASTAVNVNDEATAAAAAAAAMEESTGFNDSIQI